MPFTATLEANDFDEEMRLLTVWLFIAVGQLIFLMTWLLSISKFGQLTKLRFDLNPDERREGAVLLEGGDRLQNLVENAAYNEDLDMLIRIQTHDFTGDQALIRRTISRLHVGKSTARFVAGSHRSESETVGTIRRRQRRGSDAHRNGLHGPATP